MNTIYLNMRTSQGVETVDEFTRKKDQSQKDFNRYVNTMSWEYALAGMFNYKSSRCTKEWKQK
jgi:hypothetical protein